MGIRNYSKERKSYTLVGVRWPRSTYPTRRIKSSTPHDDVETARNPPHDRLFTATRRPAKLDTLSSQSTLPSNGLGLRLGHPMLLVDALRNFSLIITWRWHHCHDRVASVGEWSGAIGSRFWGGWGSVSRFRLVVSRNLRCRGEDFRRRVEESKVSRRGF